MWICILKSQTQDTGNKSPSIIILFHSSGLTSNQWRKLFTKGAVTPFSNGSSICGTGSIALVFKAEPFRPSCFSDGRERLRLYQRFSAHKAHSAGPTCCVYKTEAAPDNIWKQFRPDSMSRNIIPLYGQYQSTNYGHMDVEFASTLENADLENEYVLFTYLFHFDHPSSYLCLLCSRRSGNER
uniref:Ribosomal protein L10 n=1 Tax=Welwitschia mirabilis TaxID=3377 RepID=A0A0X9TUQ8_WELMI|nr:ribosomal protein L10 [Welwitschia mirabilis]AMA20997.1 ribosomal protein L10 [Welwitschia mirabilis]QXE44335.1 ribosomal protein L10 [Welwitschia mirabilis]